MTLCILNTLHRKKHVCKHKETCSLLGDQWPFLSIQKYLVLMIYLALTPSAILLLWSEKSNENTYLLWLKLQVIAKCTKQKVKNLIIPCFRVNHFGVLVSCFHTFFYFYTNIPSLFLLKDKWAHSVDNFLKT